MLIAMVLDSPVEVGIAPLLMRQMTYLLAGDLEGLKITSLRFTRFAPWQPRKEIQEYLLISRHPTIMSLLKSVKGPALILLVLVMQQDNLSSLTKLPRTLIQDITSTWCTVTFDILREQLRQFRRKDANRMERDTVYPILEALVEAAGFYPEILAPIAEQACFFCLYDNLAASDSVPDPTAHIKTSLLKHQKMISHIRQEIPDVKKHLDVYCSYWLKQMNPHRATTDSLLRIFASAVAHLNLANVIDISPDCGIRLEQQDGHVNGAWEKVSRLGPDHLGAVGLPQEPDSLRAFISDVVEMCMPFQDEDMIPDISDHIARRSRADHDETALAREMVSLMNEYPFQYPEGANRAELVEHIFEVLKKRFQDEKEEHGVPWAFKLIDAYCGVTSDARSRDKVLDFLGGKD